MREVVRDLARQLARVDRFGHESVATGVQGGLFVALYRMRGDGDDDQITRRQLGSELAGEREAGHPWQLEIEEEKAWMKCRQHPECRFGVVCGANVVALRAQEVRDEL